MKYKASIFKLRKKGICWPKHPLIQNYKLQFWRIIPKVIPNIKSMFSAFYNSLLIIPLQLNDEVFNKYYFLNSSKKLQELFYVAGQDVNSSTTYLFWSNL